MKKLFFTLAISSLSLGASAQKIAVTQDFVTVSGQPYARFESGGPEFMKYSSLFYVNSLQGERLLIVQIMSLNDPATACPQNPTGMTYYLQYLFPGTHTFVETPWSLGLPWPLDLGRLLYRARLLKNGVLDPQAVNDFAVLNGCLYTERRQALNQLPVALNNYPLPAPH